MTSIKGPYFRQIMEERGRTRGLYFYHKDQFHLIIHEYYYKYNFPYISGVLNLVSFGSLLLTIIHL